MPLGELYYGRCQAAPDLDLDEGHQATFCNHGYARGHCDHLPAGSADAHRYSITGSENGSVDLIWIVERDHCPERHGSSQYSIEAALFDEGLPREMALQAAAFVASYLNGKASQGSQRK
jgi:hypothetical protein